MPWGVERGHGCQPGKPFAVFRLNADGTAGDLVPGGCHVTKEGALAHQRALYATEPMGAHSMREQMTVPVEWKAGADGFPGTVEGYFSVFGNVDLGNDVVLPGAYKKTLAEWTAVNRGPQAQPLPLIADHELSSAGVIGSVREARETQTGGWFKAGFSGEPEAQSVRRKMMEGHIRGVSFSYEAVKHYPGEVAGKAVRFLQELKLFEITVTPFPMNPLALASAKADRGNIETAAAADLDAAARAYAESQGWAMPGGGYPIRPAGMHGAADLSSAIQAVGRGSGSHDAIRRHIMDRARAIGMTDQIPANWSASGGMMSLDFDEFSGAMRAALTISYEPAQKAAVSTLIAAYQLSAAAPVGTADDGPPPVAPGGEPPSALAGHIAQLETERARNQWDRLEADLRDMKGGQQ
jgi:HK97 family phage prohead protease